MHQSSRSAAAVVVLGVLCVLAASLGGGRTAGAQSADDARAARERVRAERAQLALQVDALEADDAQLDQAIRDIDDNLRAQQARLADARRAAEEATRRSAEARAAAEAKRAEVESLQDQVRAVAVDAYVKPPLDDSLDRLKADTATEAARKQALLEVRTTAASDVIDQLRAARAEHDAARREADAALEEAERHERDAQQRTIELQQARAVQSQFADQLQSRLNAKLAEAGALARVDAQLSATIAAEQAALAARLRAVAPAPAPATPASVGGPSSPNPPPPPSVAPVPLRTVRGITVHARIAGQLESLLAAASADGLTLGGTGYRDPSQQIALRRAHCGDSYYAIYQMPPFLCTPPTAIPGSSLHEQGLAVDFTWNNRSITTRDNAAFAWLAANAARFGFYNLPSEPWHWSVSGA